MKNERTFHRTGDSLRMMSVTAVETVNITEIAKELGFVVSDSAAQSTSGAEISGAYDVTIHTGSKSENEMDALLRKLETTGLTKPSDRSSGESGAV